MLKNHVRFAYRNLLRGKLHSLINTAGLSVGLAVALLIGLWVADEYSFDRSNPGYASIAKVMQHTHMNGTVNTGQAMPVALGAELRSRYGHYFKTVTLSWWLRDHVLSAGDRKLTKKGRFMEETGPGLLALEMLRGSTAGLHDPGSILLSASAAKAMYGEEDPTGRVLRIDNKMEVRVTGVYADIPQNSAFYNTMFIAPWDLLLANEKGLKDFENVWNWDATEIYVRIADDVDMEKVSAAICNSTMVHLVGEQRAYTPSVFLHPMSRWHLYSTFTNGVNDGGKVQYVRLFGLIAIAVLLLACINFTNLSTARSERRAKEVGIRKAIGSRKMQLLVQFFCESMLAAVFSLVIAMGLVWLLLPAFNTLADKTLVLPWGQGWFWVSAIAICMVTGLVAGIYPAFYLSSFNAVKTLKGTFKAGRFAALPRRVLVVLQCSVSVVLIIGTLIVYRQVQYAKDRPVGYEREGLLSVAMNTPELATQAKALRAELLQTGKVVDMAQSSSPATWVYESFSGFSWPGKNPGMQDDLGAVAVTTEYGKTLGWQFRAGRDFSAAFATDSSGLILNEAAVKYMGLRDPVGATISWDGKPYTVIGVTKDMVMETPYEPVRQTIYYLPSSSIPTVQTMRFMLMRIRPGVAVQKGLSSIREAFRKVVPAAAFEYKFVDEEYSRKFAAEEKVGRLTAVFSILAIFISCLGIFGMASFMVEQRVREIGIRKVLGASVPGLWQLLSKDFVMLVVLSLLVAMPVAYFAMSRWLQGYTYRTGMDWTIFAAAGMGAILVTLLTVSWQVLSAARANPVKSLRMQ